jgi:hypothetical protein
MTGVVDHRVQIGFGPGGRTVEIMEAVSELKQVLPEMRKLADVVIVIATGDVGTPDRILRDPLDMDVLLVAGEAVWPHPQAKGRVKVVMTGNRGRELLRIAIRRGPTGYDFQFEPLRLGVPAIPEDPHARRLVEEDLTRLNGISRAAMTAAAGHAAPPDILPFLGAAACAKCHPREHEIWSRSAHPRALATLAEVDRDYTVACVYCHVTGWASPDGGGFVDPASTSRLGGVQCEACHGPGQSHVSDPKAEYGQVVSPDKCFACHDQENSPKFDADTYWQNIAH